MTFGILETILILLVIAVIISAIFHHIKIPEILGYVVVGVIVGPNGLAWVPNEKIIADMAEFGIVFLMFTVGLQFSLTKMFSLRYRVFVLGGLQVSISIIITTIIAMSLGMTLPQSIVVGGIVAMSSTAIVTKQLGLQHELHYPHAHNAVGMLLFQDLAVIPFFVLLYSFTEQQGEGLAIDLFWALLKGIGALVLILFLGKTVLQRIIRLVHQTRSLELFSLTVLLITLSAAWFTHVLGLSMALGGFLAGMMLAETECKKQIEDEIRPFRDVLLGLFFISIGMLLAIGSWKATWPWILLLFFALMVCKTVLIYILNRLSGYDREVSMRTSVILAHGGEFGIAILNIALLYKLLPTDYGQVVLGALLLSIALAPILIKYNRRISERLVVWPKHARL